MPKQPNPPEPAPQTPRNQPPRKEPWERPVVTRAEVKHDTAQSIGSTDDGGSLTVV